MSSKHSDDLISLITNMYSLCNNCGECSLTCPSHFYGLFNPMGVLRRLQRDGIEETIKSEPIYNCLTCNRCMTNCPNSSSEKGMNFARLILHLREYARINGINTPQTDSIQSFSIVKEKFKDYHLLKNTKLVQEDPTVSVQKKGPIAFFTGDSLLFKEIDELSHLDWDNYIISPIKLLNTVGLEPVLCDMYGSGHDPFWMGYYDLFRQIAEKNIEIYKKCQVETIICEDAESYYMWKYVYPQFDDEFSFNVVHLCEYLASLDHKNKLVYDVSFNMSYIFHDVSRLGRNNPELFKLARNLLDMIPNLTEKEMDSTGYDALDYKMGYYTQDSPKLIKMWRSHLKELSETNADYFLTTSLRTLIALDHFSNELSAEMKDKPVPQMKEWSVFLSRFLP